MLMRKILVLLSILMLLAACRTAPPQPVMAPPRPVMPPPLPSTDVAPSGHTPIIGGTENIPAEAKSSVINVDIAGFAFNPGTVNVKVGDTVTWTNKDGAPHTVTVSAGAELFDSGSIGKGQSYSHTFTKTGTYQYKCSIHPGMTGIVSVE
jgi:amicyanin